MRPKRMEDLAAFSAREVKRAGAEKRDEYSSAEEQLRVKVGGEVIPAIFLKVEGRRTLVRAKDRREGQIEKLKIGKWSKPRS